MKKSHRFGGAGTASQGRETDKFEPQMRAGFENEIADTQPEKPLDSGDATGAPTPKRYKRELALRAWEYLGRHDAEQPLPAWVAEYLREVSGKIIGQLGLRGGLSPDLAQEALGLLGDQWPKHHPDSVFAIINAWLDPDQPGGPQVSKRKAGAVRYIKEHMGGDRNAQVATVIEWYRKGQKAHKRAMEEANGADEGRRLVEFDQARSQE